MPYVVTSKAPSRDLYDKVAKEIGVQGDPPSGLIVHTACESEGGVKIVDIWESREDLEAFERDRLMPALKAAGVDQSQQPTRPEVLEAFDVVRGA